MVATRAGPQMASQPSGAGVVGAVAVVRPATGVVNVTSSSPSLRLLELAAASAAPAVVTPTTAVIVPTAVTSFTNLGSICRSVRLVAPGGTAVSRANAMQPDVRLASSHPARPAPTAQLSGLVGSPSTTRRTSDDDARSESGTACQSWREPQPPDRVDQLGHVHRRRRHQRDDVAGPGPRLVR